MVDNSQSAEVNASKFLHNFYIYLIYRDGKSWGSVANFEDLKVAYLLIGTIFFDEDKSHMHVILRTISSFFPHQKILFLSKVMPLKICDTSPGFAICNFVGFSWPIRYAAHVTKFAILNNTELPKKA